MKFAVAAVITACVVSVQGFSVTMSAYLDNLGGNGGLDSFGSQQPSPASGHTPAPAPAPYTSSFADTPANTNLNYMASLDSGGQMKSGPNFSGVSSTFSSNQSIGNSVYLDNLKGGGGAAPSYSSSPVPAPATAAAPANTGSYLSNLGGGAGSGASTAVSSSYSMMQNSFAAATDNSHPAATSGYLGSL